MTREDSYGGTKTGATEENYNAKLVWHTGDNGPTLYLRNAVIDDYNEELGKWRYSSATATSTMTYAGMFTGKAAPLKIVVEGGESLIKGYAGLQYQNHLTIESVGDAKLTLWTNNVGIVPSSVGSQYVNNGLLSGNNLTLNANLSVSQGSWSNVDHSGYIIRVVGADLTINGGKITTEYRAGNLKSVRGIGIQKSGNLYVNGGYVYSESYNATNNTEAAIEVADNAYIAGGTVEVRSSNQSGLRATNIYITGGTVLARVSLAPLLLRAETGVISFTGGVVDALGTYPFRYNPDTKSQSAKEPVLAEGFGGWVGLNPYVVEAYTDTFKKYVKVGYGTIEQNEKPVPVPGGDILLKTTVKFGTLTLELKKYDEPVYTINKATETTDVAGNAMTRYTQTTSGANADNWNAMFIWKSTDDQPTLYLRGLKVDDWNEVGAAANSGVSPYQFLAVNPNSTYGYYQTYSLVTGSEVPTTIVLTGEDSLLDCQFGITYNNDLTIKSEGDAKLVIRGQSSGVTPNKAAGFTLTVDANLDITIRSLYNTEFSAGCLLSNQGDIIINGGDIKLTGNDPNKKNVNAIVARGTGADLIINGGKITGSNNLAQSHANAAIQAKGKLIINGGEVNSNPKVAVGLYGGEGIEFNGGVVNVTAPWYGVTTGTKQRRLHRALP